MSPESKNLSKLDGTRDIRLPQNAHDEISVSYARDSDGSIKLVITVIATGATYEVTETDWARIAPKLIDSKNIEKDLPKLLIAPEPPKQVNPAPLRKLPSSPNFDPAGGTFLEGTAADEFLFGNDHANQLYGLGGNDVLDGGDGKDILSGGAGTDRLDGGAGDDILSGGAGTDTLDGGAGDDILSGGAGTDRLDGGAGADIYRPGGKNGVKDKLIFSGRNFAGDTQETADTIEGFEFENDIILLTDFHWWEIVPALGTDSFLEIRAGDNLIDFKRGHGDPKAVKIEYKTDQQAPDFIYDEEIQTATTGENYSDKYTGSNSRIHATGGTTTLNGGDGHDRLIGSSGDDTLNGGDGNDVLIGGAGRDDYNGGDGADVFVFSGRDFTTADDAGTELIQDYESVDKVYFDAVAFGDDIAVGRTNRSLWWQIIFTDDAATGQPIRRINVAGVSETLTIVDMTGAEQTWSLDENDMIVPPAPEIQ